MIPDDNLNGSSAQYQKLNILLISSNLNLPKIYVQKGLNNLFSALGELLKNNNNCKIELGSLGNIDSNDKIISHSPIKIKKESIFNNKLSVKGLLLKSLDKSLNFSNINMNSIENNRYSILLNKSSMNNSKLTDSQ
jgi:hypothetical protein